MLSTRRLAGEEIDEFNLWPTGKREQAPCPGRGEHEAREADIFPGAHSGAEQLPNFLDGPALTVVNAEVGHLSGEVRYRAPAGKGWGNDGSGRFGPSKEDTLRPPATTQRYRSQYTGRRRATQKTAGQQPARGSVSNAAARLALLSRRSRREPLSPRYTHEGSPRVSSPGKAITALWTNAQSGQVMFGGSDLGFSD